MNFECRISEVRLSFVNPIEITYFWIEAYQTVVAMMEDTPEHVKKMQLEIWLAKPVEERLRLTLEDNDALYAFWYEGRKNNGNIDQGIPSGSPKQG